MKAIVVGSGAGGATAARELSLRGFQVMVLEAGGQFKPLTRRVQWTEPLRRFGLMGSERTISKIYPGLDAFRSQEGLVLVRGLTVGGCTAFATGNILRAEKGLADLGLDLTKEYEELEKLIHPHVIPRKRWSSASVKMFEAAEKLGLDPQPTPKCIDGKCVSCGLCEVGCDQGAKWDSRRFLEDALKNGAKLVTDAPVQEVVVHEGRATGVLVGKGGNLKALKADLVVLAAGGIGTGQILKASQLPSSDKLWVDLVLTLGGEMKNARQLKEVPMSWYTKHEDFILSPYIDILSHWFHKPWRKASIDDRVGLMIKLADAEIGSVDAQGKVSKGPTAQDENGLRRAKDLGTKVMEEAGIGGPFVDGMLYGGHFGGTSVLKKDEVASMHNQDLPKNLWVADLSLLPKSQGMPTILTTCALALRVARSIPLEKRMEE